jgi:hypothetical protein
MGCPGGRQRVALNSADKVFRDLRDLSFAAVGPQLGQRAKSIQSDYKTSKVAPVHTFLQTRQTAFSTMPLWPFLWAWLWFAVSRNQTASPVKIQGI